MRTIARRQCVCCQRRGGFLLRLGRYKGVRVYLHPGCIAAFVRAASDPARAERSGGDGW